MFPLTETYSVARENVYTGFSDARQLAQYLLFNPLEMPVLDGKTIRKPVLWVPGNHFGTRSSGPVKQCHVMIIGKMPGLDDLNTRLNFTGPAGRVLFEVCHQVGLDPYDWYLTSVCRFMPPDGGKTLKPPHLKDCISLLAQEIALVRPRCILLLGSDAVKVVCGKKSTLSKLRSQVLGLMGVKGLGHLPESMEHIDTLNYEYGCSVLLSTVHPGSILRENGYMHGFVRDMELFKGLTEDRIDQAKPGDGCDYRYMSTIAEVRKLVDEILGGITSGQLSGKLAIDCEWGGSDYKNGALRTVQLSWKERTAAVIRFNHQGMKPAQPVIERSLIVSELRSLLLDTRIKVIGHNIRADAKWLEDMGVPIMDRLYFDTMLADHALNENAEHDLGSCAVRYTDLGRYDYPLVKWLSANGIGKKIIKQRGYDMVPDDMLELYGACDADATFRSEKPTSEKLALAENAGPRRCYFDTIMPCNQPIHEIETVGLPVDWDRMTSLVKQYDLKKIELLDKLRCEIKNDKFNPRSYPQVTKLLFAPKDQGGFGLIPYKTTEKPARMWEDILYRVNSGRMSADQLRRLNPSTDAETLEALATENISAVKMLRDFKIIDQVQKSFLRLPDDEDNEDSYTQGLVGAIDPDCRIRTNLSQMSETGRHKSSDPNLQNLPKRQEKELERIMGEDIENIRSCFVAPPGCVIIEADFKSAELVVLGRLANCDKLVRDVDGDLHARGAVSSMGAPVWDGYDRLIPPPEEWLSEFKHLRIARKTINFGIPYQRGAKAIAREVEKTTKGKIRCTKNQAQDMIEGFYKDYEEVRDFVKFCQDSVLDPQYIENPYGRRRRFFTLNKDDESMIAAMQREAVNFPIQSSVADALNTALVNLYWWRILNPGRVMYKIALAVHDAVLLYVPGEHVPVVMEEVLPQCMKYGAVVPSWKPSNSSKPTVPFSLEIDTKVSLRWDVTPTADELKTVNVPDRYIEKYAKKPKK